MSNKNNENKEDSVKSMMNKIGLDDFRIDEKAKKILDTHLDSIEKWRPKDIWLASVAISRHALAVKLQVNRFSSLMEYYKFKIREAKRDGIDDNVFHFEGLLSQSTQKRNFLFDIPEKLTDYANTLKKFLDKQSSEEENYQNIK